MDTFAFGLLILWSAVLCGNDLRARRLPNALTGAGALGILLYALCTAQFGTALLGAALLAVPYLLVHLGAPAALGAGDVKLAVGLGAAAALGGAGAWVAAAVVAPVLTALIALGVLLIERVRAGTIRPVTVPHGPAMCLATVSALAVAG